MDTASFLLNKAWIVQKGFLHYFINVKSKKAMVNEN